MSFSTYEVPNYSRVGRIVTFCPTRGPFFPSTKTHSSGLILRGMGYQGGNCTVLTLSAAQKHSIDERTLTTLRTLAREILGAHGGPCQDTYLSIISTTGWDERPTKHYEIQP